MMLEQYIEAASITEAKPFSVNSFSAFADTDPVKGTADPSRYVPIQRGL